MWVRASAQLPTGFPHVGPWTEPLFPLLQSIYIELNMDSIHIEVCPKEQGASTALEGEPMAPVECSLPVFSVLSSVPSTFMATWNPRMGPYLEIGSLQM